MSAPTTTPERLVGEHAGDRVGWTTPTSRHPGDAVRVGLGMVALLISILAIQRDDLSGFEVDLFRLVNNLPDAFAFVLGPVMQLGNVIAVPVVAAVALVAVRRHRRVAADVAIAGVVAWFAAKAVKGLVERPRPGGLIEDVFRVGENHGLGFVSGHVAVSTAIVAAASPYLPRWARRLLWVVPITVGIARIYYGAHLPLDIVGGAALGWAIAAALHLVLGAPHRVPTLADAERALTAAGVDVEAVEQADDTARGSFPFVARVRGTTRFIKLLDPEPRDRDLVYRVAKFLAFRDVRDEATATDASAQAHREAAMTLLAATHGARVPTITAIESDHGRVWIVEEHLEGATLDRLPTESLTDDLLDAVWHQLALLREGNISHQDLVASNIIVDSDVHVWIVDFAHAKSSTRGRSMDNDVAELLVSTALLVGAARSVAAARRVLGDDAVAAAIPELQPFVRTAENRSRLRRDVHLLATLRTTATEALGIEVPKADLSERHVGHRVGVVALAVGATIALVAVAGTREVADVLSSPGFRWLGFALLCVALLPVVAAATLISGIDRRLALGRTAGEILLLRYRATLDGRDIGRRTIVEQLLHAGVPRKESAAALHRWTLVHLAMSAIGLVVLAAAALPLTAGSLPDEAGTLGIVLAVAVVVELLIARRAGHFRRIRLDGPALDAGRAANLAMLVVAGALEVTLGVLATLVVVLAMGGGAPIAAVCLVALATAVIARGGPNPGAPGVGPAALALGLAAVGVPVGVAVASAVVAQLLQVWLLVLGGMVRGLGERG